MITRSYCPRTLFLVLLIGVSLPGGCTQKSSLVRENFEETGRGNRILIMPMDIELTELQAGGLAEPKAAWTEAAQTHLSQALREELLARDLTPVQYKPPTDDYQKEYRHNQLIKLHRAVRSAILQHEYTAHRLQTKKGIFDWTLGEGVSAFRDEHGADYAFFINIRDTYASAGQQLVSAILSVLVLFPIHPGGRTKAVASLVDLHNGDIVWFSRLLSDTGDLRSLEEAREVLKALLITLPL